ncbi:MAG: mechanosensitive ion channel protein MscS, partial [Gammaproteobacteria bacterium]
MRRLNFRYHRVLRAVLLGFLWWGALTTTVSAQDAATGPQNQAPPDKEDLSSAPAKVDVQPVAQDEEIRRRLQSVMEATGWFTN